MGKWMTIAALALALGCGDDGGSYDPCEGLSCSDECQLCDPADPGCNETDVVKRCDSAGVCQAGPVTCE